MSSHQISLHFKSVAIPFHRHIKLSSSYLADTFYPIKVLKKIFLRVKYHVICDIFDKHYAHAVCKCIKWLFLRMYIFSSGTNESIIFVENSTIFSKRVN